MSMDAMSTNQTETSSESGSSAATFEQEVESTVPAIQDLFATMLEEHCGDGDAGITMICDRMRLHRKLAWQVRNVAYSPNPFRAVRFMPSNAGISTLTRSLRNLGVEANTIQRLEDSARAFRSLVDHHAGDRTSLEMLVGAHPEGGAGGLDENNAEIQWREKAFLGNSFIWGAQAKTQMSITMTCPSDTKPNWFDLVQVRGLVGLRRVRPDIHWLVGQSVIIDDVETPNDSQRLPLDADAASRMDGVPILADFCSQPLPQLRRRKIEDGLVNDELLPAPVGTTGQQTIVTGEMIRALAPNYATYENKRALFGSVVRTPSEVFVHDHFVHRDLFPNVERELCVFGELNSPVSQDDDDLLPVSETVESRGMGMSVARMADVPGYMNLLKYIFDSLGWNAEEFNVFRVRMEYPPMPSSVMVRHPLPDLPEGESV